MRTLLGVVLGVVARLWLATLRVHLAVHPDLERLHGQVPWVLSFFHGTQWPLLAWRRRRDTLVMVSHSADGSMQARALSVLGFKVVRGSSSRGGARALASIVRLTRRGDVDVAFAVDGPRGPQGHVKAGAVVTAQRGGGVLVPMGGAISRGKTFTRAWDRFGLAWPFTHVAIVLGAPLEPSGDAECDARALQVAIQTTNSQAQGMLAPPSRKMLALQDFSASRGPDRDVFERN